MTMAHLPPPPEVVGGVEKLCDKENSFTNGQKLGRIIFCHHNTSINNMAFVLFCHQHNLQNTCSSQDEICIVADVFLLMMVLLVDEDFVDVHGGLVDVHDGLVDVHDGLVDVDDGLSDVDEDRAGWAMMAQYWEE